MSSLRVADERKQDDGQSWRQHWRWRCKDTAQCGLDIDAVPIADEETADGTGADEETADGAAADEETADGAGENAETKDRRMQRRRTGECRDEGLENAETASDQ